MRNKIRSHIFIVLIIVIFSTVAGCSYYPSDTWRTSTPEKQGVDSEKLYKMIKGIKDNNTPIDSLLIIRNGYIITEAYFDSNTKDTLHDLFSCTKSVTSALSGIAINEGFIGNIDIKLLDLYKDYKFKNVNQMKRNLTLKHLLTMSAGFDWFEMGMPIDSDNPAWQVAFSPDMVQFMMDKEVTAEPGTTFNYNSGESDLISSVITKTTGMDTYTYAQNKLFGPLGISKVYWGSVADGTICGASGLNLNARDMAKFGYLFLNKGNWDGKQIVPEKWVEESTKKQIDADLYGTSSGYGYQWWMNNFGGYSARGLHGQYIIVMPDLNMVVVFQSHFTDNDLVPLYMMESIIIPAVKSSHTIPPNTESAELLKSICN